MPETNMPPELAVARQALDRNLAPELVRVTEAAAMAAGRWVAGAATRTAATARRWTRCAP